MLVILPDPTTRPCPKHHGEYMTDSRCCIRCAGDQMIERLRENVPEITRTVKSVRP